MLYMDNLDNNSSIKSKRTRADLEYLHFVNIVGMRIFIRIAEGDRTIADLLLVTFHL